MKKEQFLSGVSFKVKGTTWKGAETYFYDECIMKESRSSVDDEVLFRSHHCNVLKIGRTGFTGFVYVMSKKVNVKYKFEDLIVFEDQGPQYDGAGFSVEDREQDPELQSHHCDDPSCNCSI